MVAPWCSELGTRISACHADAAVAQNVGEASIHSLTAVAAVPDLNSDWMLSTKGVWPALCGESSPDGDRRPT